MGHFTVVVVLFRPDENAIEQHKVRFILKKELCTTVCYEHCKNLRYLRYDSAPGVQTVLMVLGWKRLLWAVCHSKYGQKIRNRKVKGKLVFSVISHCKRTMHHKLVQFMLGSVVIRVTL